MTAVAAVADIVDDLRRDDLLIVEPAAEPHHLTEARQFAQCSGGFPAVSGCNGPAESVGCAQGSDCQGLVPAVDPP